jgi:hypothetical protein
MHPGVRVVARLTIQINVDLEGIQRVARRLNRIMPGTFDSIMHGLKRRLHVGSTTGKVEWRPYRSVIGIERGNVLLLMR